MRFINDRIPHTPPQVGMKISFIPRLQVNDSNESLWSPFVRTSINCFFVEIKGVQITPFFMFSTMKCLSTATCLVLSWYIGLWTMLIAALLSQYNFIEVSIDILNSLRSLLSHKSSQMSSANALNFASTLLLETIDCFLLLHVTKLPPTKV